MARKVVSTQSKNRDRTIDVLTAEDYEIFKRATRDVNWFSDYYFRSPTSGTRWRRFPDQPDPEKEYAWEKMWTQWRADGAPQDVWYYQGTQYKLEWDESKDPVFWHHHGFLWMPWQQKMYHSPQPEVTIVGGFGCGKTAAMAHTAAALAAMTPYARIYCVAPQMIQAQEVYRTLMTHGSNTPWMDRWVWNSPTKPYPKFVLRSDYVGESTIEMLSIEDDPQKVLTLEGDIIMLDQAEKIQDLDELIRALGSRLRGQVQGRSRLGKLVVVANAGDNPQLWQRFDLADDEPQVYVSFNPTSWDNIFLTKADIENLKRRVSGSSGHDEREIDQWMRGQKPMGRGKHFPAQMVKACVAEELDRIMDSMVAKYEQVSRERDEALKNGETFTLDPATMPEARFIKRIARGVGTYQWEMPPDHQSKRQYCVIADPGQGNPPHRNSPVIGVWDITDFPKRPITLRAFHWVFANGSYWPFVNEYERYVKEYRAQSRNAFDSTGVQKGFDELVFSMQGLYAEGLNMAQNGKYHALNALKFFLGKGLMRFPYIGHLVNQLTTYDLPDNKLNQDIVMMLAMTALYVRRFYYEEVEDDETLAMTPEPYDRWQRTIVDRYERNRR